jgi:hypothetical protein
MKKDKIKPLNSYSKIDYKQLSLFEPTTTYQVEKKQPSFPSKSSLEKWKKRINNYQQQIRNYKVEQKSLLNNYESSWKPEDLDPFSLTTHADQFYDLPQYKNSESCLYFILDVAFPLLLYVGETKLSPKERWKTHDCKNYLKNYLELHRIYQMKVTVRSAFWWGIPPQRKFRQTLEKELILRWRSPFNKENWPRWGQPFKS